MSDTRDNKPIDIALVGASAPERASVSGSGRLNLFDLDRPRMEAFFEQLGEKRFRAHQVMKWIHHRYVTEFEGMTDLGKALRAKLEQHAEVRVPQVVFDKASDDGTHKWLLGMDTSNAIETVYIPDKGRGTLCVSSQVGCALNCQFCSTATQGFNRNLTTAEIIGQVWVAARHLGNVPHQQRKLTNVVMMGMGEPLQNYAALVPALRVMLDDHGYGLSRRRVTVSTSGVVPMMDRLREDCPVALAVSLHAPTDALRSELVPLNRKYPLAELIDACNRYLEAAPRDFITFEYCMLDGVNDGPEHARALVDLVRGRVQCKFNLIPFNPFPASGLKRSPRERVQAFAEVLIQAGIVTTVRKTRGDDIDAACGQLAGEVQDRTNVHKRLARQPIRIQPISGESRQETR